MTQPESPLDQAQALTELIEREQKEVHLLESELVALNEAYDTIDDGVSDTGHVISQQDYIDAKRQRVQRQIGVYQNRQRGRLREIYNLHESCIEAHRQAARDQQTERHARAAKLATEAAPLLMNVKEMLRAYAWLIGSTKSYSELFEDLIGSDFVDSSEVESAAQALGVFDEEIEWPTAITRLDGVLCKELDDYWRMQDQEWLDAKLDGRVYDPNAPMQMLHPATAEDDDEEQSSELARTMPRLSDDDDQPASEFTRRPRADDDDEPDDPTGEGSSGIVRGWAGGSA